MNATRFLLFMLSLVAPLFTGSLSLSTDPKPVKNITVIGTVFCDACSNNTFSNHSYFLQGAKVLVECKLRSNSKPNEELSITVDRTADRFGVYKLDIPSIDFGCTEGRASTSFCQATLVASSSPLCDVPGIKSSTEHVALKNKDINACLYNLNALSYRPAKKDPTICGTTGEQKDMSLNSSLFFWPPFPPFGFPWPHWPPFPFPFPPLFPSPPSLPFPFPPLFPSPPSLPFPFPPIPFFTPPPPAFPFPLPPLWPTPQPPPSIPFPFPPLPPVPSFFPSPPPPPPSFPFPIPPLPPFTPIPFPPLPPFTPIPSLFPPPPPPPPPPSFPFLPPFPPLFPTPSTPQPPSPPPTFSLTDPRTWFPYHPPSSSPSKSQNHNP